MISQQKLVARKENKTQLPPSPRVSRVKVSNPRITKATREAAVQKVTPRPTSACSSRDERQTPLTENTTVNNSRPKNAGLQKFTRSISVPIKVLRSGFSSVSEGSPQRTPRDVMSSTQNSVDNSLQNLPQRGFMSSKSLMSQIPLLTAVPSTRIAKDEELEIIRKQVGQLVLRASHLGPSVNDRSSLDSGWRMLLEQSYKREKNLEKAMTKAKAAQAGTREVRNGIFSINYELHEAETQKKIDKLVTEKDTLLSEARREASELKLLIEGLKKENYRLHRAIKAAGLDIGPAPQDVVCLHTPHIARSTAAPAMSPSRDKDGSWVTMVREYVGLEV